MAAHQFTAVLAGFPAAAGLETGPELFAHSQVADAEGLAAAEAELRALRAALAAAGGGGAHRSWHHPAHGGFVYTASPFCHHAARDGVAAVFAGEVTAWPDGHDLLDDACAAFMAGNEANDGASEAARLLALHAALGGGADDDALALLAGLEGAFAFLIVDEARRTVLAARDRAGAQQMWWATDDAGSLLLSTDLARLEALLASSAASSPTPFPPGCAFFSRAPHAVSPGDAGFAVDLGPRQPGRLRSFVPSAAGGGAPSFRGVRVLPRIDSRGCLRGGIFRVESERGLAERAC